jgi:hypothetical protein
VDAPVLLANGTPWKFPSKLNILLKPKFKSLRVSTSRGNVGQKPLLEHKRNRVKCSDHCLDRRNCARSEPPSLSRSALLDSTNLSVSARTFADNRTGRSNSGVAQERFPTGLISNVRVPSELAFSALELYKNGAKKFNVNRGERACCSKPGAVAKRFVCGTGVTRFGVANIASIRASCASPCESSPYILASHRGR